MEIREYPTQDFHALNRACVNDELFDLVVWALIRKTFISVSLEVLARDADDTYPLRLRFYRTAGSHPYELILHSMPEAKMDSPTKDTITFYADAPDDDTFGARLKDNYISIESEQIAWAELVQSERAKRWDPKTLSLWHAHNWSLVLTEAPHSTLLAAPLAHASGPAESLLIQGDSFLTIVADEKAQLPSHRRPQIIWQIVRELTEFVVIRYEPLNQSHPSGSLTATYSWRVTKETVVKLHKKHRSLSPPDIDELLGFFPVSDEWRAALRQIDREPVFREGRWFATGHARDLTALLDALPKNVEQLTPYDIDDSGQVNVLSFPKSRGLLTYKGDPRGGINVWLSVYQNDERFEHAIARGDGSIASNWPPKGDVQ